MTELLQKIANEGVAFKVEFDVESVAYLAIGLFVALFLALLLSSITYHSFFK